MLSALVFCNHFTKHILAYVTPNQTAKPVAKFLWQGYILILEHWPSSWVIDAPISKVTLSKSCVCSWAYGWLELHKWMDRLRELTKCLCTWEENWVETRRQIGPSIYQSWYMLSTQWDWSSPDTFCTTLCSGANHDYHLTFTSLQWGAWRNIGM